MFYEAYAGALIVGATAAFGLRSIFGRRPLSRRGWPPWWQARRCTSATAVDVRTLQDAHALVARVCDETTDADALMAALVRVFSAFPPAEQHMRVLSIERARLEGTGGRDEFVVCTVLAAAMLAICERGAPPPLRRTRSCPARGLMRTERPSPGSPPP